MMHVEGGISAILMTVVRPCLPPPYILMAQVAESTQT